MLTPEERPRFLELLDRLTQPGPKAIRGQIRGMPPLPADVEEN